MKIDIDMKAGPWPFRVWGLIINLVGNALALYGISRFLRDGFGLLIMIAGLIITAACILILAMPSADEDADNCEKRPSGLHS